MNRGKKPLTARDEKKITKEVKHAERDGDTVLPEKEGYKEILAHYPEKEAQKLQESVDSLKHEMEAKKAKKAHKTSKRTNPGDVSPENGPSFHHYGGATMGHDRRNAKAKATVRRPQKHK